MDHLLELIHRYPVLSVCEKDIEAVYEALTVCFEKDNRLYICGNGGSAADALHIVGELVKSFVLNRSIAPEFIARAEDGFYENLQGSLPAFALVENTALATAFANDCDPEFVFAQQVYAYARDGDCVLGISTSGNSENVINAFKAAKGRGATTIGLGGGTGGKMEAICDYSIIAPETDTNRIQELHLPIYHTLCLMIEQHFWGVK